MQAQLSALPVQFALTVRRSWTTSAQTAQRWYGAASGSVQRNGGIAIRALRRWLRAALAPVETVLLSAPGRDRVHATATFALIFMFAVASVDFLIVGGFEFAPARAAQPQRILHASYAAPVSGAPIESVGEAVPTAVASTLANARAARVTAVSQNFQAPTVERADLASLREDAPAIDPSLADLGEPLAEAAGPAAAPEAAEDSEPRKNARVKAPPL